LFRPYNKPSPNAAFGNLIAAHPFSARGVLGATKTCSNEQ